MLFVCPKCREKLNITDGGRAVCARGHSYDRAKEGYYNLLLGQGGGTHGDNAEMVAARRRFLERGFYEPLAARMAATVCELLPRARGAVLDAGCGEGYYTEAVARAAADAARILAFDISKDAVKRVAKRGFAGDFAVASAYKMPIADGTVDVIFNVFSPFAKDECHRVLRAGGYFIAAIAGEEHLFSLKEKIYDTPYKNTVADKTLEGFELVSEGELRYDILLENKTDVQSLFMMTPYAYRTSEEGRARVNAIESLQTCAHFYILVYRRK